MRKLYLLLLAFITSLALDAQVTVTPPTLTVSGCSFPTAYSPLGDITLTETAVNDISASGDFVLTAPVNFEFQAGVGSLTSTLGSDLTLSNLVINNTTITFTITVKATSSIDNIIIGGIQVRGINGVSGPSNILRTAGTTDANILGDAVGANISHGKLTSALNALPTPTFTASPGTNTCASTDVTYTTQGGGGETNYVWNVPGVLGTDYTITSGGIGTTSNTVTLKWLTTGSKTVTVNYDNASGCTGASAASSTTTVNALPIPTFTVSPGANTCASTDVIYTTQAGQSNYVWNVPGVLNTDYTITAGGIGTGSNTVTLKWLTTGSKTVTVNYDNASGCTGASAASSTTTVNALPIPTFTVSPGANTCASTDIIYTTQAGQSNYVWNVPGVLGTDYTITSGGTGTGNNTLTLKWLTAGSKTVTVNYNNSSGCAGANAASSTTTVSPLLPVSVTIVSDAPGNTICAGTPITFTATPINGGAPPAYQWQINAINVPGATSVSFSPGTINDGDVVTVVVNSNATCATGSPATSNPIKVKVNPLPTATAGVALPAICQGATSAAMGGSVGGGATGGTWSGGAGPGPMPIIQQLLPIQPEQRNQARSP